MYESSGGDWIANHYQLGYFANEYKLSNGAGAFVVYNPKFNFSDLINLNKGQHAVVNFSVVTNNLSFNCPQSSSSWGVVSCDVSVGTSNVYTDTNKLSYPASLTNLHNVYTVRMELETLRSGQFGGVDLTSTILTNTPWISSGDNSIIRTFDFTFNMTSLVFYTPSVSDETNAVNNLNSSVLSQTTQQNSNAQKQLDATNKQTEQQKNQYDQEKEEENRREEESNEQAGSLAGIFNITLMNPFAGIWEMFNPGGCTSIPTISSWLGSKDKTYCSWWPQNIRAVLTPVFSIASMIVLFGFVVRWLGGGNGINIEGVKL